MLYSLGHHAKQDAQKVVSVWRTLHWMLLVTVLIGVLFVGVQVAQ